MYAGTIQHCCGAASFFAASAKNFVVPLSVQAQTQGKKKKILLYND
jgi:hypothetical protein